MVSCIITTFNRPVNILKRAIDSVVGQSFQDIELIIVNDCPQNTELSEKIRKLIQSYSLNYITYIVQKVNSGACAARNTGLMVARGRYIAFLDDDDEWLKYKLEKQIQYMNEDHVGLVFCDSYMMINGRRTLHKNKPKIVNGSFTKELLIRNFIGSTSFPLLLKKAVVACGGFDEKLKSSQDVDMWIRISEKYKCVYCPQPLVNYYMSEVSITSNTKNKLAGYDYLLIKYNNYFEDKNIYYNKLISIAGALYYCGDNTNAKKYFKKAIGLKPLSICNVSVPLKFLLLKLRNKVNNSKSLSYKGE